MQAELPSPIRSRAQTKMDPTSQDDASSLFDTVLQDVRNSLPEPEQQAFIKFKNFSDMMAAVRSDCEMYKQSSKLSSCASKIAAFSRAFAPFFEVINIFVQVKPEWLGIFWGSVRLVFQLGHNHSELLEKITDMLVTISWNLPQYQRHMDRARKMQHAFEPDRLVRLMSYVYADVIKFIQRVHWMFLRGKRDARLRDRLAFLTGSFWKPFDARFSDLVDKMKTHQSLFEKELYIEDQEELRHQFQSFEALIRVTEELSMADKLKLENEESRLAAEKTRHILEWLGSNDYRVPYERARRMRFEDTGNWLFDHEAFKCWRDDGFGDTKSLNSDSNTLSWLDGILSLQAKPGYGKTVLSTAIIDYLSSRIRSSVLSQDVQPASIFFHFERGKPQRVKSGDAMKALASQLIHSYRNDRAMLDGLTLLTETRISGQPRASDEDTQEIIKFLFDRFPCYIVMDGVDECVDQHVLLSQISHLRKVAKFKILLLSRPDTDFPYMYRIARHRFKVIKLSESQNLPDIGRFLIDEIGKAIDLELFGQRSSTYNDKGRILPIQDLPQPEDSNLSQSENPGDQPWDLYKGTKIGYITFDDCADDLASMIKGELPFETFRFHLICAKVAARSSGMFLWARLLVNYLNSPALSPNDRFKVLAGVQHLEGIDNLYQSILQKVVQKFQKEKHLAMNIFKWLTFALYPLSIDELHTAIVQKVGRCTLESDRLIDFTGSVEKITCALVEIEEHGTPRFIHTSFADFLRSDNRALFSSGFSLTHSKAANSQLATSCLSYLLYDVPHAPLHNLLSASRRDLDLVCREDERLPPNLDHKLGARRRGLRRKYPFLRYASLCWSEHLSKAWGKTPISDADEWTELLSKFLLNRIAVTAWVEACWTFKLSPSLSRLEIGSRDFACNNGITHSEDRELIWTLRGLATLSYALDSLQVHTTALNEEPARIWLPQIRAIVDPAYWPNWEFEIRSQSDSPEGTYRDMPAAVLPDRSVASCEGVQS